MQTLSRQNNLSKCCWSTCTISVLHWYWRYHSFSHFLYQFENV